MPSRGVHPCLHCHQTKDLAGRGLCHSCYGKKGVRCEYPPLNGRGGGNYAHRTEPTEEELEAMIAEQMKNLPPWWEKERRAQAEADVPPLLAKAHYNRKCKGRRR